MLTKKVINASATKYSQLLWRSHLIGVELLRSYTDQQYLHTNVHTYMAAIKKKKKTKTNEAFVYERH